MLRGSDAEASPSGGSTVIGVIATNAALSQAEATKVARMAHDGLARSVNPSHTPWDGDTLFSLATGELVEGYSLTTVGALAADMVAEAIVRAVLAAESIDGYPAARDMSGAGAAAPR